LVTAPAIPEGQRRSIFEPLTRGVDLDDEEGAEQRTSLGLGLYIAHEIASAHGGTLDLTSSEVGARRFASCFPGTCPVCVSGAGRARAVLTAEAPGVPCSSMSQFGP